MEKCDTRHADLDPTERRPDLTPNDITRNVYDAFGLVNQHVRRTIDLRCPLDHSSGKTMSITQGRKGVLIACGVGCDRRDILDAVGLEFRDLFWE